MLIGGVAVLVLAAGAVGAGAAWSRQKTPAQRYRQFLATVPGYATAVADGSLVPLHKSVRIGDETVQLRAFYATYFGSYVVFTAEGVNGSAAVVPNVAGQTAGAIPGSSAPTAKDAIAGYFELAALQVPSPDTSRKDHPPTRISLILSLAAVPKSSANITIALPKHAYTPRAVVTRRHPLTIHANGVTVRFVSLQISSAGTMIRGEIRGTGEGAWIQGPHCPAFLGMPPATWKVRPCFPQAMAGTSSCGRCLLRCARRPRWARSPCRLAASA